MKENVQLSKDLRQSSLFGDDNGIQRKGSYKDMTGRCSVIMSVYTWRRFIAANVRNSFPYLALLPFTEETLCHAAEISIQYSEE